VRDRADRVLFELGLVTTRSQAKSLIEKGDVTVNGRVLQKSGDIISSTDTIQIGSPQFVGRGAFKLLHAINEFDFSCKDLVFLDIGASTGGFTEILLKFGARRVYAIDVGHQQLAPKLRQDPKVVNLEGTNIREVTSLPEIADGAVIDLSFISLTKVLLSLKKLLKSDALVIALVKPQFEAGIERLPKDGVIKDEKLQAQILKEVIDFANQNGWNVLRVTDSPIEGKSGNREYLALLQSV
jgi:23S rRNA (cytidine1920-2'-O)/16S rRNA (cytidine1409-2'-O)-methyltransferase